jgi:hypothetical protein
MAVEGHTIEVAKSGRSSCQTCDKPIAAGDLRLAEAFVHIHGGLSRQYRNARSGKPRDSSYDDDYRPREYSAANDVAARFHHLSCAAAKLPYVLKSALAATKLEIVDRAELERAIEKALSVADIAEEDATTGAEYRAFIEKLRNESSRRSPNGSDDAVLVFGDWLQSIGDPRGELIITQTRMEDAAFEERTRLVDVEQKLLANHRARFLPERLEGTPVWRRGFVHRLVIDSTTGIDPTTLARAFAHPSFRLLRELAVELQWSRVITVNLPSPLPDTLRAIELGSADEELLGDGRCSRRGCPSSNASSCAAPRKSKASRMRD